ncbi:glycosyltransferase family 2 protein [Patescibacteria group bacterium]|nr:glycosyltransferase family 2 protein [Patescibacteria group bacterium]
MTKQTKNQHNNALTIIIICGNFENTIGDCIKSIKWANEIIIVFANSTDNSKKIAQKLVPQAKTITTTDQYGKHYAKWRNMGLKLTTNDWILYIDTDEQVTPQLKREIQKTISVRARRASHNYYAIPRANHYLGKRVKHGGSYPDYVKRLFKKDKLKKWQGTVHEEPIIKGQIGHLKSDLLHFTHSDLSSMLEKTITWTELEAKALYKTNHPPVVWWRFFRMMLTTFYTRLIKQQAWKDGTVGWISVIFETFNTFIIYARLYELQQNKY